MCVLYATSYDRAHWEALMRAANTIERPDSNGVKGSARRAVATRNSLCLSHIILLQLAEQLHRRRAQDEEKGNERTPRVCLRLEVALAERQLPAAAAAGARRRLDEQLDEDSLELGVPSGALLASRRRREARCCGGIRGS